MPSNTLAITLPGSRARWLAIGLMTGFLVAGVGGSGITPRPALAVDATPSEHTVSVTGTGRVLISPDVADLRLGVSVTASTVKTARSQAAGAMTKVIAALKKLGIADADIQTTILSLQPAYDYTNGGNPPRVTGYNLSNAIAVTIRDLDKIGDAIDGSLAAGATTLDGVSFRVNDPAGAQRQAREQAMGEAKSKAQALAAAAGVSISGVSSISETVAPTPYPIYYGAASAPAAKDIATPVQPGTNDVEVTISVVYLIG